MEIVIMLKVENYILFKVVVVVVVEKVDTVLNITLVVLLKMEFIKHLSIMHIRA